MLIVKRIYRKARSLFKPKQIYKKLKSIFKPNSLLLARTACLGQDIIALKFSDIELVNHQKVRADLFLSWINGAKRPDANVVRPFMLRQDVFPFIEQQANLPWLSVKKSNKIIIIDSFAELTDQKFVNKNEGWAFCCHYSDIEHSEAFENEFECQGLLDINSLESSYDSFFDYLTKTYPEKTIIFIHFPTTLDNRELYKKRGVEIKAAVNKLRSKYNNLISIALADELILPHENDDFPYHFGKETYSHFVTEINNALSGNYQS